MDSRSYSHAELRQVHALSDRHSPNEYFDRESVLIVDDSPTVRASLLRLLKQHYECCEAANVAEALEKLKTAPISLVITDVIMPGLSGVELLRIVMDRYPQTAVIVVSSVDRPQRALDAVRLGAFDYLIKPCDEEVLELTVARALERRRLLINAAKYKTDLEERNRELSERKAHLERLQAEIVHNEKMASIGKLAAGIAHEINNPVGFVSGNLEFLGQCVNDLIRLINLYGDAGLPEPVASAAAELKQQIDYDRMTVDLTEALSDCQAGVGRVREIVQNLRTFSRLDEAELKRTDVHEGLDSTIRLLSRYFSGGGASLVREYGDVPEIDAFSARLNQVWMNLLVNAAQAIGKGPGEVCVRTFSNEDSVVVSISDTGAGIAREDLNRIFDPFFTTKPVGEGSGLGLSIAFGIVERHNGRIEVQSEPGKGTTFNVILPQQMDAAAETRAAA
ncbi:MAG: response regulator [Acidobacteria bacterium]|nr:response regulator [Acidobacteriota bacterium]